MHYRELGKTGIRVSALGLGTMTFGEQNSEREAHAQLDCAVDAGINFIDTAEMYPVPPREYTRGLTERYIGNWLQKSGARDRLILATKVSGPADWLPWIRDGHARLDRQNIVAALHDSLKRLGTDYIDLYQVHWPDRETNFFGKLGYRHVESRSVPIEETLAVLGELVAQGKIRHIGISNETPWGTMRYLDIATQRGLPRIASIQNPYNLLNRNFEVGLAEIAHREAVGLLAYSPLGFGVLSGKYLDTMPPGARLTLFERFQRYSNPEGIRATRAYVALAREHGLDPAVMALAFVNRQPFVTSNIIGATTLEQLRTNLASIDLEADDALFEGIAAIHQQQPNPCP